MKHLNILISNDGKHAHYFERLGLMRALNAVPGINVAMYECKKYSPFDIFDQFNPDVFIGQLYNLDRPTYKCILERPHLKVALRAGDWGDFQLSYDNNRYGILYSTPNELEILKKLKDETGQPEFVFTHYDQESINKTHNYFIERLGIKIVGIPLAADIFDYYNGQYDSKFKCDVSFVGGWWPYKGINLDRYLRRLCFPLEKFNVKIFSSQPWPNMPKYCGQINSDRVKDLFASSTICPNISEPHSTDLGIDMNERIFKVLASGGFCINDNVEATKKLFTPGMEAVYANTPDEFEELVDLFIKDESERIRISNNGREKVLSYHTYFDRADLLLKSFGYNFEEAIKRAKNDKINSV